MKIPSRVHSFAILLAFLIVCGSQKLYSQNKSGPAKPYHYASAIVDQEGEKCLYISEVVKMTFVGESDASIDPNTKTEIERQFLEYLEITPEYGKKKYSFLGFSFSASKNEISKIIKAEIKKYQSMGFQIKIVKGFTM